MSKRIFFSVGEPSGDQHAACLIRELHRRVPDLVCEGFTGPLMEQEGCHSLFRLTNLAVMGFLKVVPLLLQFYRLVQLADRWMHEHRPDAVILIDFPGFNWWIARKAKRLGIPVIYYLPPQLWAWAPWRIRRIKRNVDEVICGLGFERDWYSERGVPVTFVGHPFFDEVAGKELDQTFLQKWASNRHRVVGILPGSRTAEVTKNFPAMLEVIRRLHILHPDVTFLVANYRESHRTMCEAWIAESPQPLPVVCTTDKTSEIIQCAECVLMVSGSVSLEIMARGTPAVVLYRGNVGIYLLAKLLLTCKYMSLPNLMVDREIMPEFPFVRRLDYHAGRMANILDGWLVDELARRQVVEQMLQLKHRYGKTGATVRTAEVILNRLGLVDHDSLIPAKRAA
ncbi:MAG: lipid-A-disaccharide synthase [Planctomycetota bacterium]|nr:lipid-A-disaccharide synthase [Planctomycetota bacterium]MDA1213045.1 lipid-A-disaccharide synthase [Planctomycetota bacterium]